MSKKVIVIAIAILICGALVPNLEAQTTLLTEGFESSFPPPGWTVATSGGPNQWFRNDYTNCYNYTPGNNGYCACNDDDYWGFTWVQNNTLTSPTFDASVWDIIDLQFEYVWQNFYGTEHAYLDVYNGSSWVTYEELGNTGTGSGILWVGEITSTVNYATDARIRFRYHEDNSSAWAYWFEVDDVLIGADTISGGPGEDSVDLELATINRPLPEEAGGEPFTPSCKVYCNLDGVTGANVVCKIKEVVGTGFIYQDDLSNVPFDRGYTDVDAFKDFTPEGGKKYSVLFVVEHPDDNDESNNFKDRTFTTTVGAQVDATEIPAPDDDQQGAFDPKANFQEMLGEEGVGAEGVMLRCKIEDAALHAVVYEDSVGPENFDPDEIYPATFPNVGEALEDGNTYTITFWATLKNVPIGEDASKNFNFKEGVAETPVLNEFSLDVVGTTVNYTLGKATDVTLRVYDLAGNLVATLASGTHNAGSYTVNWNTTGVASGVYFVKMLTPDFSASDKIVVLY